MNRVKFPHFAIQRIASIIASKDSSSPLYLKGPELVQMFDGLGFSDSYTFADGRGIQTPDYGEGLSRINYTLNRLEILNKECRMPEVCRKFSDIVPAHEEAVSSLEKALEPFSINLFQDVTEKNPVSEEAEKTDYSKSKNPKPVSEIHLGETYKKGDLEINDESVDIKRSENILLGDIPDKRKVVFISYSWDNPNHKQWVGKLADDLTEKGIYVLLDEYNLDGIPLDLFMERGIQRADKVLVIGTPNFTKKYNSMDSGAAFEGCIIRSCIIRGIGTKKIIPCLREGDFDNAFPMIFTSRKGHDFSEDKNYDNELDDLCREIYDCPKRQRPKLGKVPNYDVNK